MSIEYINTSHLRNKYGIVTIPSITKSLYNLLMRVIILLFNPQIGSLQDDS